MEQKAIQLSERFFETMIGRYVQDYRETKNALFLIDTILEGIAESIYNIGVSYKIRHDFECYFFDNSNIPNSLKFKQTVGEDGMTPISFELKEGSNRLFINEKRFVLEVKNGVILRKIEYQAKNPYQLIIKDNYVEGKKKEPREVTISTFDEQGYEQHRLNKTVVIENCKSHTTKENEKSILEVSEWYRNPEHQEQVIVTECEVYTHDQEETLYHTQTNTYYLEPSNMHQLDALYRGTGILSEEEKEAYYHSHMNQLVSNHKIKELKK